MFLIYISCSNEHAVSLNQIIIVIIVITQEKWNKNSKRSTSFISFLVF